ncbi:MAG: DUF2269 domain-containing protein [Dongiaceae bacterium]
MWGYGILLTAHIISAAVLFGTGLGIAYFMAMAWWARDVQSLAVTLRHVVIADFLFTASAVVAQPLTGIGLIVAGGHDPWPSWLIGTYVLYALAGGCWLPVVWIQIRLARMARAAAEQGTPLPAVASRLFRWWALLGIPAFIAVLAIYLLMVFKFD